MTRTTEDLNDLTIEKAIKVLKFYAYECESISGFNSGFYEDLNVEIKLLLKEVNQLRSDNQLLGDSLVEQGEKI